MPRRVEASTGWAHLYLLLTVGEYISIPAGQAYNDTKSRAHSKAAPRSLYSISQGRTVARKVSGVFAPFLRDVKG